MKLKISLIIITFLLTLNSTSAQSQLFEDWNEYMNIPDEWSTFPEIIYFVFIPFIGVFAIIFGVLTTLNLFNNKKVDTILAFIFALSILYSGTLMLLVHYLFSIGAAFAVIVFFVSFIILTILWAEKVGKEVRKSD